MKESGIREPTSKVPEPVGVEDVVQVALGISPLRQDGFQLLKIGDGAEIGRHVVEPSDVASHSGVAAVSRQLADMVDVVGDRGKRQILRRRFPVNLTGNQHPGIQSQADDRGPIQQQPNLLVG